MNDKQKRAYDATVARMAANIAAMWSPYGLTVDDIARRTVEQARAIIAETIRTEPTHEKVTEWRHAE